VLRGDAEGFCDGFEIEISFDTDEPEEHARQLIRLARQMCFTEKALSGVPITAGAKVNGQPLE
jgi:organic hydroperoxide reductase OsmC/OhrA